MADHVGEQFGEYRLTRQLGGGTFGDVYLAEHIQDNTPAAIKVLLARLTHSEDLKDFINEIRTLFRLQHPNIVPLLDFGIERDSPFLIMAYAPHGTLRQPRGKQLPLDTVVTCIRQVAEALQFAHDRKLIHRDVKPDNILSGPNSQVWLSDFGITTIAQSSRSLNTQDSAGTITYMAPEQILGKPRQASDQYALGVIAYEWICGARPFNGTAIEVAMQHAQAAPPPMREKLPTLSPAIEQVVLKALEKDYEKRFGSVREFAQALAEAVEQTEPTLRVTGGLWLNETLTALVDPTQAVSQNIRIASQPVDRGRSNIEQTEPVVPRNSSERWLEEGSALQEAGRYEEAIEAYSRAIALDPQNAYAYSVRGDAYSDLEQYRRAIKDYGRAIALDPQNAETYNDRGLAYASLNQHELAIENYNRAITINPQVASAYGGRALANFALRAYRRAIEDYDRAIALDPRYAVAYGGRGRAYYHLGDYRRAIWDFDYALQLEPDIGWFRSERDDAYRRLGRLK
jgi:serine/threonine protein kinase